MMLQTCSYSLPTFSSESEVRVLRPPGISLPITRCRETCIRWLFAFLFIVGYGCGPPDISTYDDRCESDEDCVAVYSGCATDACSCEDEAIAQSELSEFTSARTSDVCPRRGGPVCECSVVEAFCGSGTCELRLVDQ